jgi:hypothetical protein
MVKKPLVKPDTIIKIRVNDDYFFVKNMEALIHAINHSEHYSMEPAKIRCSHADDEFMFPFIGQNLADIYARLIEEQQRTTKPISLTVDFAEGYEKVDFAQKKVKYIFSEPESNDEKR